MNSKYISRILCLSFLLLFAIPAMGFAAKNVSVKGAKINVRTGPGTNFPVYMVLLKGYPLKVIQTKSDWLQVTDFENDKGWVFAKLVGPGTTVIANGKKTINMRTKPSTNATILATVPRGNVLTKLSTQGKWTKVKHISEPTGTEGRIETTGWIHNPLLWP